MLTSVEAAVAVAVEGGAQQDDLQLHDGFWDDVWRNGNDVDGVGMAVEQQDGLVSEGSAGISEASGAGAVRGSGRETIAGEVQRVGSGIPGIDGYSKPYGGIIIGIISPMGIP